MKKFIPQTVKGVTSIYECEVSVVRPRPLGLSLKEELYKVELPKKFLGEEWYSMFFTDSLDESLVKVSENIRVELKRAEDKKGATFSEEDVASAMEQIIFVNL